MNITVTRGDESETLSVTTVDHDVKEFDDSGPRDPGDEAWVVKGLQPDDTELIPNRFVWLSGSLGYPMSEERQKEFPLVYVPKDSEVTIDGAVP